VIVQAAELHVDKEKNLVRIASATAWGLRMEQSLPIAQQEVTEDKAFGPKKIVNAPIHVKQVGKFTPVREMMATYN